MCIASKYLGQIDEMVRNIEEDISKLNIKASEYDKQLSLIYHRIEQEDYDVTGGYHAVVELQDVLRRRRIAKNERDKLKSIKDTLELNGNKLENANMNLHKLISKHNTYTNGWDVKSIEVKVLC